MKLIAVCSNKPRSSTNRPTSASETHHLCHEGEWRTLCGRDTTDWLNIGTADAAQIDSAFCCARCRAKAKPV
jgi:hypothetical protein